MQPVNPVLTPEQAELAALRAENARLTAQMAKATRPQSITLKVSTKGAVSAYGLGRWPTTLYLTQWVRLLNEAETIKQFLADNQGKLAMKEGE